MDGNTPGNRRDPVIEYGLGDAGLGLSLRLGGDA